MNSISKLEKRARGKASALGHVLGRLTRWTYKVGTEFNPTGRRERPRIGGSMFCIKCDKGVVLRASPRTGFPWTEEHIAGFGVRDEPPGGGNPGRLGRMVWWQAECGAGG